VLDQHIGVAELTLIYEARVRNKQLAQAGILYKKKGAEFTSAGLHYERVRE
jgi:hypothetical protein